MPLRTRLALVALGAVAFAPVAPAHALVPHRVVSYSAGYVLDDLKIVQGDSLTLVNADHLGSHDLVARDLDGGQPRFRSGLVAFRESSPVNGVAALEPGAYAYYCSVHESMIGTFEVLAAPARS
jgi:plastocyanin